MHNISVDVLGHPLKQDNYSTVGGDRDVGSARYEPALLPSCPTIKVLILRHYSDSNKYVNKDVSICCAAYGILGCIC